MQNLESIPHIYPNFDLDAWVVMPNHIHAIVIIREMSGALCRDVPVGRLYKKPLFEI